MTKLNLVSVDSCNVDQTSFFCMQSKANNPGHMAKRRWLEKRFTEGLRIQMLGERDKKRWNGERGFIEYIPGKYAWRAIEAADYMVIHCLWVVGRSRGKGGGRRLLDVCMADAKKGGFSGVATVTAENGFAAPRALYERMGFSAVAECDPRVALMVHRFDEDAALPSLSAGPRRGPGHYDEGMTIIRGDQCPYIDDATGIIIAEAERLGIAPIKVVELRSAQAIRKRAPSPYGVFSTVLDGHLLSYRYLTARELQKAVARIRD